MLDGPADEMRWQYLIRLGHTLLVEGCLDSLEWVRYLLDKAVIVATPSVRIASQSFSSLWLLTLSTLTYYCPRSPRRI